ncbi:multicopper oxidase family protein [Streptomyces sp. NBC_01446]|uniref:multicopper oxidase family protein n=1 Tax=Streptomyces sp. NBC_01446 TaxID=2903870 RepID=UPI0022551B3C|nr:multicopper oxidase domain-containing protein [Streptomyces sp. NBC_01446]MCX4648125.1 multicopper oxidase domain-containing protein [Streptomyces sp. NBC_01446]
MSERPGPVRHNGWSSTEWNRRHVLGLGGALGLATAGGLTLSGAMAHRPASTGNQLRSAVPLPKPYTVPLPIPPVLKPVATSGGADRYEITQRQVSAEILPGIRTGLWTYNGSFPGPTIESRRGRPITVAHRNELPVPTVVHLHGGRTPAASDGYPTDLVLPHGWPDPAAHHHQHPTGAHTMPDPRAVTSRTTREYTFPMDQRAAMLWYHDHRMDFTAPAIWRGLAGMHIVRDDTEDALDLPRGERELPLMIADRSFGSDGSLTYPSLDPALRDRPGVRAPYEAGVLGDVILVNGVPWPIHEVDASRYRLRLLNASNARHYELQAVTDDGRRLDLVQIGADQGLLAAPVTHAALPIAPAERYDVTVDFAGLPVGSRVRLINRLGTGRTREVMAFRIARRVREETHIPALLAVDLPSWQRSEATTIRDFSFRAGQMQHGRGWVISGRAFDPSRTDVRTRLGAVEVWRLVADVHHPVHLHLVGFRVLARGGRAPLPHDAGLKDTISLRPGESAEIITRFDGYRGRYLFHCHNAEHEDMGMMANLEIV